MYAACKHHNPYTRDFFLCGDGDGEGGAIINFSCHTT
jgi:hypothetical protein